MVPPQNVLEVRVFLGSYVLEALTLPIRGYVIPGFDAHPSLILHRRWGYAHPDPVNALRDRNMVQEDDLSCIGRYRDPDAYGGNVADIRLLRDEDT